MSGQASKALVNRIKTLKRTERLCEIIRFFGNQEGDSDFCNMLHIMSGLGPKQSELATAASTAVYHIQDA